MPNLPFAGAISRFFTAGNYIIYAMRFFRQRAGQKHSLAIAMTGVKLGDRLLQVGCTDASLLGAIGSKVGLSGRVCAVVPDDDARRARAGAPRKNPAFCWSSRPEISDTFRSKTPRSI